MGQRGRPRKKPEADPAAERAQWIKKACALAREPFDDRTPRSRELPTINAIAGELGITPAKARKLMLTGDFYSNAQSRAVLPLWKAGYAPEEIAARTGLSLASVYLYIPYTKGAYNLKERSLNADQNARFHRRKKAVEQLRKEPTSLNLWGAVVLFQGYPFTVSGDGGRKEEAFRYTVPQAPLLQADLPRGESVEGWGNEIIIAGQEKPIARSSFDRALGIVLEEEETGVEQQMISHYIYAVFRRFGLIE